MSEWNAGALQGAQGGAQGGSPDATGARCTACEGTEVHPRLTRTAFWDDDRLVVVDAVPALVCQRCGEQFYDDATTIGLDMLRGTGFPAERARRIIEVPVFDYADAAAVRGQARGQT